MANRPRRRLKRAGLRPIRSSGNCRDSRMLPKSLRHPGRSVRLAGRSRVRPFRWNKAGRQKRERSLQAAFPVPISWPIGTVPTRPSESLAERRLRFRANGVATRGNQMASVNDSVLASVGGRQVQETAGLVTFFPLPYHAPLGNLTPGRVRVIECQLIPTGHFVLPAEASMDRGCHPNGGT